jgi:hypothetical protein
MRSEPSARSIGLQPTNQRVDSCKGHIQVHPSKAMFSDTTRAAGRCRPAVACSALRRMQEPLCIEPGAGSTDRRRQLMIARSGSPLCVVVVVVPPGSARRSLRTRRASCPGQTPRASCPGQTRGHRCDPSSPSPLCDLSRRWHRVTGGGRPPPVPTERGVRISRTTLFGG